MLPVHLNMCFYIFSHISMSCRRVIVVQSLSQVWFFATPWTAAHQLPCPSLSPRVCSHSCPLSWWCYLTISSSAAPFSFAFNLSQHQVFSSESALCIRWPKYWSFSFSISPSNEYSGLISFRIDWFDLLAVQRTLKSLLQHHSSKASILQYSTFFMVQLSHLYMTTGKTTALTIQTFVGKVMSAFYYVV